MGLKPEQLAKYYPQLNLDYASSGDKSVFGETELTIAELLRPIRGNVIEIGSADGRYTQLLLAQGCDVTAIDIDQEALDSLWRKTPEEFQSRLHIVHGDAYAYMQDRIAKGERIDAVVATSLFYLYPPEVLGEIFPLVERSLNSGGYFLFDFATDRLRLRPDGTEVKGPDEVRYTELGGFAVARDTLSEHFQTWKTNFSAIDQDLTDTAGYAYTAKKINILAQKAA